MHFFTILYSSLLSDLFGDMEWVSPMTNEVLEPVRFIIAYFTVFINENLKRDKLKIANKCIL